MTNCTDCGREISERARTCPGCGAPGPAAGQINFGSVRVDTAGPIPEGAQLAEWGTRAGAFVIDCIIIGGALVALGFFVVTAGVGIGAAGGRLSPLPTTVGLGIGMLLMFAVWAMALLYKPLMEGSRGATLGKSALGIKVVSAETGEQCDYAKAFMRWIVGLVIAVVPLGFFVDVLWPFWDERKQTLHDKVAGTLVVRSR